MNIKQFEDLFRFSVEHVIHRVKSEDSVLLKI